MSIFESILYGFVSGITEFLPVSSRGHQSILRYMFGIDSRNFLHEFLVHTGILIAIIIACSDILKCLQRENKALRVPARRRKPKHDSAEYYNLRLLKTATFTLIIGFVILFATIRMESNLLSIMTLFIINGLILFLAAHSGHGNRDARTMTGLDGIIMGILGSLSVFPGISRIGIISSYTTLRGADYKNTVNWAVLLGIPALVFLIVFDIIGLFTYGAGLVSITVLIGYILSGIGAFCGGYFAISILFTLMSHEGFTYFAYYSFGAALFTFMLYLIT